MKFVHLTSQKSVARIRRNGIRTGTGRRGKGIYAVPLTWLQSFSLAASTSGQLKGYIGSKMSSSQLWRFLFKENSRRNKKAAAIVFEPNSTCWPAILYVNMSFRVVSKFLDNLKSHPDLVQGIHHIDNDLGVVHFGFPIFSSRQLGLVFQNILSTGQSYYSGGSDIVEVVFPKRIRSKCVRKIIPFYATSKTNKIKMKKQERRFITADDYT